MLPYTCTITIISEIRGLSNDNKLIESVKI